MGINQHQFIYFSLQLSYTQFLKVYQGQVKTIAVVADDGRRIVFPVMNIQSFLTHDGIDGDFKMELTATHQFIAITKLN